MDAVLWLSLLTRPPVRPVGPTCFSPDLHLEERRLARLLQQQLGCYEPQPSHSHSPFISPKSTDSHKLRVRALSLALHSPGDQASLDRQLAALESEIFAELNEDEMQAVVRASLQDQPLGVVQAASLRSRLRPPARMGLGRRQRLALREGGKNETDLERDLDLDPGTALSLLNVLQTMQDDNDSDDSEEEE